MKRALEESLSSPAYEQSTPTSFLSILDHCRKLVSESDDKGEREECGKKYHFLRLVQEFQHRCESEGKYLIAQQFMEHELRLRKEEELRQGQSLTGFVSFIQCR